MSAIFDLEQGILKCWNITDDIGEILDDLESGHIQMSEATEAFRAYQKVYQRRFERCWAQFEEYTAEVRDLRVRVATPEDNDGGKSKTGRSRQSKGKKTVDQ